MRVPLVRFIGLSPLLCRLGPIFTFSLKAQTIFSKLLALCLDGAATAAAAGTAVAPTGSTGVTVSSKGFVTGLTAAALVFSLLSSVELPFIGILTGWLGSGGPSGTSAAGREGLGPKSMFTYPLFVGGSALSDLIEWLMHNTSGRGDRVGTIVTNRPGLEENDVLCDVGAYPSGC